MQGRFPPIILTKFPHMSPADTIIWQRFLYKHGTDYKSFDYDYHVGQGVDPGPEIPDNLRQDFILLTQKKIDAVGYVDNETHIFEVKPRIGTSALGQLLSYRLLYQLKHPQVSTIKLFVVTETVNEDEKKVYSANNITIILV